MSKIENDVKALEYAICDALQFDDFIPYNQGWDFTFALGDVRKDISAPVEKGRADQAVGLLEKFIKASRTNIEEVDDSGGSFGDFLDDLYRDWINARQHIPGADPKETVKQLFQWMDEDGYGLTHYLPKLAIETLDRHGLKEFERLAREKYETELAQRKAH